MASTPVRVLVVDDFAPFRRLVATVLAEQPTLQIVAEAADGLEAVQQAQALQPDLVLLDLGLPKLTGIEAARRIRVLAPTAKILFVSQETSVDVVRAALNVGGSGYVVKADAGDELLSAINAVLRGARFVGARFAGRITADGAEDSPER